MNLSQALAVACFCYNFATATEVDNRFLVYLHNYISIIVIIIDPTSEMEERGMA